MAKYIIDIPEKEMVYLNVWKCEDGKYVWTDSYIPSDLRPYTASESYIDGLKKGQNDAWELARRIICPSDCCEDGISAHTKEIFNKEGWEIRGIFKDLSYQEAKSKYKEWQKQKDEIHVGDEVEYPPNKEKGIVIKCHVPDVYAEVDKYAVFTGTSVEYLLREWLTKTGRVFPEVAELLKKMGEN